jgi:dephospho-CoA kinase
VIRRNGFTRDQVLAIIARQATREARLAAADDVVVNDSAATLETLQREVDALHARYVAMASENSEVRREPRSELHSKPRT